MREWDLRAPPARRWVTARDIARCGVTARLGHSTGRSAVWGHSARAGAEACVGMQANSRRGALAAALLPPLHWVMLSSLCVLLLSAFVLFDSDFSNPVAENRTIFAVLSAMLVTIVQVRVTAVRPTTSR